jgi:hypothetical protein
LPDHVHLVIGAYRRGIRTIIGHLRSRATSRLREQGLWDDRPVWSAHGWNVFLDDMLDVSRAITYVERTLRRKGSGGSTGRSSCHWSPRWCTTSDRRTFSRVRLAERCLIVTEKRVASDAANDARCERRG